MRRGQALVDSLMLILALSIVLITMHLFLGQSALRSQTLRYESAQHQSTLLTILNKQIIVKNSGKEVARGRIGDLLIFRACNSCIKGSKDYCPGLEKEINDTLYSINRGKKHYIFAANETRIYDYRKSVCLDEIPVAKYSVKTACGTFNVVYGTWFKWEHPKEVC
ncbi:MAG: hypothetical protein J7K68_01825 [Candidatus Diapherotrites archaeon]|nr:hypothetical protein [Candidatus Diapherotrites archaeon]